MQPSSDKAAQMTKVINKELDCMKLFNEIKESINILKNEALRPLGYDKSEDSDMFELITSTLVCDIRDFNFFMKQAKKNKLV